MLGARRGGDSGRLFEALKMAEDESIPVGSGEPETAAVAEDATAEPVDAATARAETVEVGEDGNEETPVIDVHAAHGGIHTWKDFWIHLGTITLGLLIAIGLEQSVEALHHLHQRHDLEASLRAECKVNKDRAEADFSGYDDLMMWLLGLHRDIGKMLATGGKANLPYRELRYRPRLQEGVITTGGPGSLVTSVWDTANADNRLALLPEDEAHAYSLLYHVQAAHYEDLLIRAGDAHTRQTAFEAQFADTGTPTTPVLGRMSAAELKEYDALAMQTFAAMRGAKGGLRLVYGTNDAVIQGLYDATSRQRMAHAAKGVTVDDFTKMEQEIDAEDAARDKAGAKVAGPGGSGK